eukprot:5261741-Pyramimonas_sp.AAC.1
MLQASGQLLGCTDWDQKCLIYGVPEPVAVPHYPTVSNEVFAWGDVSGSWGPTSYTDGPGFSASIPE